MLIGTIDFYYLKPHSLTLTLFGGHKVSANEDLFASFSRTLFFLTDQDEIWYGFEAIPVEHPNTTFMWDWMKQGE